MKNSSTKVVGLEAPHFKITLGNSEVVVLGTAHVSAQSVTDVENQFQELNPDAVCVELCKPRYDAMLDPDRWRKLDLSRVIKEKKLGLLVSSLILSSFQKKIGDTTGVKPGAEMMRATELTEQGGKELVLADREVSITLRRAWSRVGFFSKMWLVSHLLASLLYREEVDTEEIERIKQDDVLSGLFDALPPRYAHVKNVIIDERDSYLAENIRRAAEKQNLDSGGKTRRILAIVGAGHLEGIKRVLENSESVDLDELHVQPARKYLRMVLSLSMFAGVIAGIIYLQVKGKQEDLQDLLILWVAARSGFSLLGAIIARAHPLTALVTAAAAPVSVFIFVSRLWMYSALVELWIKKPRVEDFENIATDTDTGKGFLRSLYKNRVIHLIFIIMMVSMGLTVGNVLFHAKFIQALFRTMML